MSSKRKAIRAKIIEILKAKVPLVNERVFSNRNRKLFPSELPAIVVYSRSEQASIEVAAPRAYERRLRLGVFIYDKEDASDDRVDDICEQVETAIFQNETLDDLASDTVLSDTDMETNDEGEVNHSAARVTFETTYWTDAPAEIDGLDDFLRVHSEITPEGAIEGTENAVDDITIDQPGG